MDKKRTILNVAAIAVAFCLGVSIHNSCADPNNYDSYTPQTIEELWAEVKSLRAEVESLKSSIGSSNGQGGSGSSSSTSGEFKVDDLWFSRGGGVASPLKSLTYEGGDSNVYSYDKYGRLVKQEGSSSVLSYSYEGKKVYLTQKIINIDGSSNSFNIVYEYN